MNRRSTWVEDLFRPLAVGVMTGCIALSLTDLMRLIVPTWNGTFIVVGCVLAALEAHYSHRLIQTRELRGADVTRFRAIEIATILILLKISSYIGDRWVDVLADVRAWPYNPLGILLDLETTIAFVLVLLSWLASTQTVKDLERIGEPPERTRFYVSPRESLANRFFWGGIVLLIITGITRIGIAALLDLDYPSVPGLVINVLVYFLLGLVMLGQVHFTRLHQRWQAQKVDVAKELASHWTRYSLVFISLAALVAFLLPTSYTIGPLEVIATIIYTLGYVVALLGILLTFILGLLLTPFTWLFGKDPTARPVRIPPLEFPQLGTSAPGPGGTLPNWIEILRSLIFWAAALGMVAYVIRSYLRDHPELLETLISLGPIRALRDFLAALWRHLTGLAEAIEERIPHRVLLRRTREDSPDTSFRFFRLAALSPRERILYYYLSILRRAGRLGLPRHRAQTPHEYDGTLSPHLDHAQQEMTLLTQAFVEVRYSRHAFDQEQEKQVRTNWQQVKAALRALKRKADAESANPRIYESTN